MGQTTTSHVESWNHVIRSEISDIINFIEDTENKCAFSKELKIGIDLYNFLEFYSLLKNLKKVFSLKIYNKLIIQYSLGKRDYQKRILFREEDSASFQVL